MGASIQNLIGTGNEFAGVRCPGDRFRRGGLSAAVTAAFHGMKVIVAEKADVFGGTTAWSGGWMWAPRNPLAQRAGIIESADAPRAYLQNVLGNNFNEAKVDAFLEASPHMVAFFEEQARRCSSKTATGYATPMAMRRVREQAGGR